MCHVGISGRFLKTMNFPKSISVSSKYLTLSSLITVSPIRHLTRQSRLDGCTIGFSNSRDPFLNLSAQVHVGLAFNVCPGSEFQRSRYSRFKLWILVEHFRQ